MELQESRHRRRRLWSRWRLLLHAAVVVTACRATRLRRPRPGRRSGRTRSLSCSAVELIAVAEPKAFAAVAVAAVNRGTGDAR
eukprot:360979-Chlamydomonas_euryale.AAC.5